MGRWLVRLVDAPARAIRWHRLAHRLWLRGRCGAAIALAAVARFEAGIDIHPAAELGDNFTILHGVGVVIGGDVHAGPDCIVMQGVTLGSRGAQNLGPSAVQTKSQDNGPSHPRLGRGVFVGANAVLLGPIVVGDNAKIGAGAVVLHDVPAGCTAVGNPARILGSENPRISAD